MTDFVHWILEFTIGNLLGKDITCKEPVHRCDSYQPGVLIEFGRTGVRLFKKFLMPCGLCAAVPIITPASTPKQCNGEECKRLVRPSELPLYTVEKPILQDASHEGSMLPGLEEHVRNIRLSMQSVISQYEHVTNTLSSTVETGVAHSRASIDYLRDESNVLPRIGAVTLGGLTGLILGIRGGKFKKLVYTTTGAGVMASVSYPNEAQEALNLATYYANIGYNFIYGVKPGDENQQKFELPQLPKIPSSFSEFLDTTVDLGTAGITALGDLVGTIQKSITETNEVKKPSDDTKKN